MNKIMNKNVKCLPFPGIENAYVVISGYKTKTLKFCGDGVKKCMSFFYNGGDIGAEWEPESDIITVICKCDKKHEHSQEHWFYDYCIEHMSQHVASGYGLPGAFLRGDYIYLFKVLKAWAE
ncbi:MAG: hypothetical protein SV375_17335 [Thermodesulfobacteriota bacterium]|nr:hypothetical protein [Thermodesulfobacteriota bacterium]